VSEEEYGPLPTDGPEDLMFLTITRQGMDRMAELDCPVLAVSYLPATGNVYCSMKGIEGLSEEKKKELATLLAMIPFNAKDVT
jgi:hypothetical protein